MKPKINLITDPANGKSIYSKKRAKFLSYIFTNKKMKVSTRILKMYGEFVVQVKYKFN